ncbi:RidA family protein [Microbacterium sp. LWH7-1.2]|jgi:enamine deaminase RidA (YjgF/YER057c/UK114 family)|uniref:RidA family protein n=1 Tax=Microbacterium sp. LWH7-1.2 TaxID=3135257 RepID=UPI0031390E6D
MSQERFTRIPAPVVPGIADSVKVTAGDLLFVSGAVGFEQDGSVPADFARATELTLRELERALKAGGADFSSVVRFNVYVTDLNKEKLGIYRRVRDEIVGTDNLIASTLLGVAALFNDSTIEIDAIAAV